MPKNWNYVSRECGVCHRVGYRAFVIHGSEGWRCLHEIACGKRAAATAKARPPRALRAGGAAPSGQE